MMRSLSHSAGCLVAVFLLSSVGCAVLKPQPEKPIADVGPVNECTLEFHYAKGAPKVRKLQVKPESTVDQIVQQAGVRREFTRMKIEIHRPLPQGGMHRLEVSYDRGKRHVDPINDYNIHQGDRIVISEDPTNIVDDMLSGFGPMATQLRK